MNNVINNLKSLSIDMINKAESGHPGIVLSAAPIIYTVYANHMHINPKDSNWVNRDRFVLSAGHGSALLYSCLYMLDFISLDDLKKFRQIDSITPGHPEYGVTPGVDVSTGPLGQGFASAVGMSIGSKHLKEKFKNSNLIDYYVYVLCGDGDLMEGLSYEAASLAGTLKLDNLIVLYDSNNVSLDGRTSMTFDEDVRERFDAMGWYTTLVKNGNSVNEIDRAIKRAKKSGLPSLIEVKTVIGFGSLLENTNKVHGKPLDSDDILQLKSKLGVDLKPFWTDEDAINLFKNKVFERSNLKYDEWNNDYKEYFATLSKGRKSEINKFFDREIKFSVSDNPFDLVLEESTRDSFSRVLNFFADKTDLLFGGSADLFSSTKTYIENGGDFGKDNYAGANIWFGVREHAMGSILNGIALSGYLPFGSTFLAFSDYLMPAIRMSALMDLPVTYVFTHDSINASSDGPTHEPINQLSNLRSIPNFTVYRPADFKETLGVLSAIIMLKKPSAVILSRQGIGQLSNTSPKKIINGAYVVRKEKDKLNGILIATGSEVETCVRIAEDLYKEGFDLRVVSMPSMELFLKKPKSYRYNILPVGVKTFFVEAGSASGLRQFVSNDKYLICLNSFGKSGKTEDVLKKMNFSYDKIKKRIKDLL